MPLSRMPLSRPRGSKNGLFGWMCLMVHVHTWSRTSSRFNRMQSASCPYHNPLSHIWISHRRHNSAFPLSIAYNSSPFFVHISCLCV
ncbi:hypothetical protein VTN00DRAFT_5520 [Thermoascus crustaceus]|uniref:uncharacterized protein n=1 Tax=Thermoascus crustaceus TaxID=5088 RepID=UPI003742AAC8